MNQYYEKSLSAERLKKCYDIAPKSIQNFLQDEIKFIQAKLSPIHTVLELGCGYGRVVRELAEYGNRIIGIDNAPDNIRMSEQYLSEFENCNCLFMDANNLEFEKNFFDVVLCIQNGISAFKINADKLIDEILKVMKPNGVAIFSSYSPKFWAERLHWFRLQAQQGLIGKIDESATGNGIIICEDGFKATTYSEQDFKKLGDKLGLISNSRNQ